jgi:hypothetical protein
LRAYKLYLARGSDHGDTTSMTDYRQNVNCGMPRDRPSPVVQEHFMRMSDAIWIAIGTGIVIVTAILRVFRAKSIARRIDVGSVSNQWVVEHRVGPGNGVNRFERFTQQRFATTVSTSKA